MVQKYILITGISSGIGYDACEYLISKGYKIIGSVRKKDDFESLSEKFGDQLLCLIYDVLDFHSIEASTAQVENFLNGNKISFLVNNAGIAVPGPMELLSDDAFENQMLINVNAVRKITNTYLPYLFHNQDKDRSKIIFISSVSGLFASPFNGAYCISKHALECMVDIYRRELNIYNIDVVSIQPGPVQTKIWEKSIGKFDAYYDSIYEEIVKKADEIIRKTEETAFPVRKVSELLYKIITTNNPKTRYLLHNKPLTFKLLANYIPDRILDKMIWKILGKKDAKSYRPV